jgi:MsuE subfamily FMN reductase
MMTLTILAINGSLTPPPSRTRALLDAALEGARAAEPTLRAEVLELRDFNLEFCDGRPTEQYNADTRRALALVEAADAYLVATPIYRASYTGALKNFFDLIPNDPHGSDPLRGKAVGLIASGGSDHHFLVIEHQLRPLLGFFGAQTLARGIYAAPRDFDADKRPQGSALAQLGRLGGELVALARLLRDSTDSFRPDSLRG